MKTIIVAVDFSDVSDAVIDAAAKQAIASHAFVRIIHAAAPEPDFLGYSVSPVPEVGLIERPETEEKTRMEAMIDRLQVQGVKAIAELIEGPTVDVLLDEIAVHNAEMLVVGSHGHGALFNLVVGSVTNALLHRARIPVLVVPSRTE